MSLAPLEPNDSPVPAKVTPGALPELKWLEIKSLMIDETYQRPIIGQGRKTIAKIMEGFRWNRFSPLIVTAVEGGKFAIIDGQHRATAALTLGLPKVPCQIVATAPKEAPAIFSAINGTITKLSPMALFKAARAAGEEWAMAADRVCRKAGLEPLTYPVQRSKQRPRQTMIVGTIANRIQKFGENIVALGLEGAMKAPAAGVPGFLNTYVLDYAVGLVRSVPNFELQSEAIIKTLENTNYALATPSRGRNNERTPAARMPQLHVITSDLSKQILDLHERRYPKSAIAATLRVPYADVERVLSA